jgi:hypothetical protein
MPRDFSTYSPRVRSPPASSSRSSSQVSTSEETPISVCSGAASPEVRLVSRAVTSCCLSRSMIRVSIALASAGVPIERKVVMGSITTTRGRWVRTARIMVARCISSP